MVVVIWAEIWYNRGRQMRLQGDRFGWRQFGEVVEMTSMSLYGKNCRGVKVKLIQHFVKGMTS